RSQLVVASVTACTTHPATPDVPPLPLHDALPISTVAPAAGTEDRRSAWASAGTARKTAPATPVATARATHDARARRVRFTSRWRSEEHTSELQSQDHLVCRLLLEKKN